MVQVPELAISTTLQNLSLTEYVHGRHVGCSQRQINDLQLNLNRQYESSSMAHGSEANGPSRSALRHTVRRGLRRGHAQRVE